MLHLLYALLRCAGKPPTAVPSLLGDYGTCCAKLCFCHVTFCDQLCFCCLPLRAELFCIKLFCDVWSHVALPASDSVAFLCLPCVVSRCVAFHRTAVRCDAVCCVVRLGVCFGRACVWLGARSVLHTHLHRMTLLSNVSRASEFRVFIHGL